MSNDSKRVKVVFRKYKKDGEIIALFPGLPHDHRYCMSFVHVGQHGGADYNLVVRSTVPAKPEEFASLKLELESKPYNYQLDVGTRRTAVDMLDINKARRVCT